VAALPPRVGALYSSAAPLLRWPVSTSHCDSCRVWEVGMPRCDGVGAHPGESMWTSTPRWRRALPWRRHFGSMHLPVTHGRTLSLVLPLAARSHTCRTGLLLWWPRPSCLDILGSPWHAPPFDHGGSIPVSSPQSRLSDVLRPCLVSAAHRLRQHRQHTGVAAWNRLSDALGPCQDASSRASVGVHVYIPLPAPLVFLPAVVKT
jgi:hypothetical protein